MDAERERPILIFGATDLAAVLAYYLRRDAGRRVDGFVVDAAYRTAEQFEGLPLVAFEDALVRFPPDEYEMLLPLGWTGMNAMRRDRMLRAREAGYRIGRFVSSAARVAEGASPGKNTCIGDNALVGPFCSVGSNVQMRSAVVLSHHVTVGDHCFIGGGVHAGGRVTIGERCVIGLGAVLRSGVKVAERCFIGAGAVVVADTEPDGVYVGCPARRIDKSPLQITGI